MPARRLDLLDCPELRTAAESAPEPGDGSAVIEADSQDSERDRLFGGQVPAQSIRIGPRKSVPAAAWPPPLTGASTI